MSLRRPELLKRSYYSSVDMSKSVALIIDILNHDGSLSEIMSPVERLQEALSDYRAAHPGA